MNQEGERGNSEEKSLEDLRSRENPEPTESANRRLHEGRPETSRVTQSPTEF